VRGTAEALVAFNNTDVEVQESGAAVRVGAAGVGVEAVPESRGEQGD